MSNCVIVGCVASYGGGTGPGGPSYGYAPLGGTLINFISGGSSFACSGTLLNDLDGETVAPYFLTANHCIGTQAEADSMEVVYFWQSATCGGALPNYSLLPRSLGGTLLNNGTDNDRSFIRLRGALMAPLFAGTHTVRITGGFHFSVAEGDPFDFDAAADVTYHITVR